MDKKVEEKSEAQVKLEEKMNKISEFAKSLQVGFAAKLITTEDGIRPVIAYYDNESAVVEEEK